MENNKIFKKIFNLRILLLIAIAIILMLLLSNCYGTESWYPWVIAITSSIIASFMIGIWYQFIQIEQVSDEHLKIMEYLNEKNSSGITKYYGNFGDSIEDIKKEFLISKKVDIYLTYGYTILNNLSDSINYNLSIKENEVNIFIMDKKNPFISSLSKFWYGDNQTEKLANRITETECLIINKYKELKNRNSLNGKIKLYSNKNSPVNYSFYLFDEKVFFVPSKNILTKEIAPITILAQKTSVKNSLYKKVSKELLQMKEENCFIEINLDEK